MKKEKLIKRALRSTMKEVRCIPTGWM